MRILMVHNYYNRDSPSGENTSFESEVAVLREYGQHVDLFTRSNDHILVQSGVSRLALGLNTIWSSASLRSLCSVISSNRPEVCHFQNTFPQISPSAYLACRRAGIPVVQTLRNYRLLCPNGVFHTEGRVCEDCLGKMPPWPGVARRCHRRSLKATTAVAAMLTVHGLLGTWQRQVDLYVALTEFARRKYIQAGFPPDRIVVKPNFVHPDPGPGEGRGGYALFVGRLSPEKGLRTLLDAWERLGGALPLKIVGDGPERGRVAEAAARVPFLEWLGRRPVSEVYELMGGATLLVFPSEWYETFGRVAVEAFAKGTPVVASNIGAIAELVEHGRTGLLFRPGAAEDLAAQVDWAYSHPQTMAVMRREARAEFEAKYTAQSNYELLMDVYSQAIAKARDRR